MPHNAAGCLIEPPVSVPMVNNVERDATAEADPPDDPPGDKSKVSFLLHGFIAD